jgi:hypothetical protein
MSLLVRVIRKLGFVPLYSVFFLLAYGAFIYYFDTRWRFIPYTMAVTISLAGLLFLLSRRVLFSLHLAALFFILMTFVSLVKFKMKGLALHIYDVVFSGSDTSVVVFLAENYTGIVAAAAAGLVILMFIAIAMYRLEPPSRMPVHIRALPIIILGASAFAMFPMLNPKEEEYLPFLAGYNASALPLSLWNMPDLLGKQELARRVSLTDVTEPFGDEVDCRAGAKKPDFFLVLAESQTAPDFLPDIPFDHDVRQTYLSADGRLHSLYVETVSGGTWMTNFSVLTGLSTADFGWQAAYVTRTMQGKVKGALPDVLARCGYRTIAVMPMESEAMNEGPFLSSIGFQEIYDARKMGYPPLTVRDKAYFNFVEKLISEHRKTDNRPLFIEIQTMFTHSPYTSVLLPEATPGETVTYADDVQINEYLRRIKHARDDLKAFHERRKMDPGPNGSLIAEFGDHHSYATRAKTLAQHPDQNLLSDFRSPIYRTYFSVHNYGTPFDHGVLRQPEDAAFLAARLMAASLLPRSPAFAELADLSTACSGRFFTCTERRLVDAHLKKRIAAGTVVLE